MSFLSLTLSLSLSRRSRHHLTKGVTTRSRKSIDDQFINLRRTTFFRLRFFRPATVDSRRDFRRRSHLALFICHRCCQLWKGQNGTYGNEVGWISTASHLSFRRRRSLSFSFSSVFGSVNVDNRRLFRRTSFCFLFGRVASSLSSFLACGEIFSKKRIDGNWRSCQEKKKRVKKERQDVRALAYAL